MENEETPQPPARIETDEELLSIPDPNVTGSLRGTPVVEDDSDADR